MTVETETALMKLLEELKADFKEARKDLTDLKVTLARLEGDVKTTQVEIQNLKEEIKEIKSDIKGRISIQTYWFLLLISLLVGIVGKFAFFPNT